MTKPQNLEDTTVASIDQLKDDKRFETSQSKVARLVDQSGRNVNVGSPGIRTGCEQEKTVKRKFPCT